MKRLILLASVFSAWQFQVLAQVSAPAVTNVVTQVSEDRDKVTITYDLARRAGVNQYSVAIRVTLDGELVPAQALSGDVGPNITPGYGKRIVWDVLKDVSELYGALKVEVTAKSVGPDCIPMKTIPVYAGLTGAGATGIALILAGLKLESDSKDLYDVYKNNLDPNSTVYNETSREQYYLDANSKHKKGTWLAAGGGTVIVAGGVLMVARLIQIKKYNKDCGGKTSDASPFKNWKPIVRIGGIEKASTGIAINF